MADRLIVHTVISPMFDQNAYLLFRETGGDAIVIDPGFNVDELLQFLAAKQLRLSQIWNTHGHLDHVVGNGPLKERFPEAPMLIGRIDAPMLTDPELNLSRGYGIDLVSPPADQRLDAPATIDGLGLSWQVRFVPGHSPGHVAFMTEDHGHWVAFVGDVLMRNTIGRWDFPGSDERVLLTSIAEQLYPLPDETVVYPGHGPTTTIGGEKALNPFASVAQLSKLGIMVPDTTS